MNTSVSHGQPFQDMEAKVERLDTTLRACLNLLFLGKTLKIEEIEGWMDGVEELQEIGLLEQSEEGIKTAGYSILPYLGRYFVVNLPAHYPTSGGRVPLVYIGRDSFRLGQNLFVGNGGEVLDLCSGSGIIAILSAPSARSVIGVEINKEAVEVARFNVILNDLENKVEILKGDLFRPIGSRKFDIIYSNPPFVPVPPGLVYSLYGDGGIDGLKVTRRILEALDEHLRVCGRFLMVGNAIGDDKRPFFVGILERLSIERNWAVKLILYGGEDDHLLLPIYFHRMLRYSIVPSTMNPRDIISDWMESYKEMGAEYVYSFLLSITKQASRPKVEIVRLHTHWGKKVYQFWEKG